jgi:processive 1,2-diacylglycerol beta-glucosyltransferase
MHSAQKKVLILSCGTGEGHNSASRAIEDNLKSKGIECVTLDVLSFKSEKSKKGVCNLYSAVIRHVPAVFGAAYNLGKLYDDLNLPSPVYWYNARYSKKLYDYIIKNRFSSVICPHLFSMQAMTEIKRVYSLPIRVYGVLTDYTTIPFYRETDLDCYFVPTYEVGRRLVKKGISASKICVSGIPVNDKFVNDVTKEEARETLNLPKDKKIVAVLSGGAGCGKIFELCKKLKKGLSENALVLVFVGRNVKLKQKLENEFGGDEMFKIISFTDKLWLYLKASDVAISKAGGLSSTEIAVSNVPLVHLKAIPGLESANVKYFSKNGISCRADKVGEAVKDVNILLSDRRAAEEMKTRQSKVINRRACEVVAEKVLKEVSYGTAVVDTFYSSGVYFGECDVLQPSTETNNG